MDPRRVTQIACCSPIIAGMGLAISACTLAANGELIAGVWAGAAGVAGGASLARSASRPRSETQSLPDA